MKLLPVLIVITWATVARAQDAYEIQVYDANIDEPGHAGLEVHLNYTPIGVPATSPPIVTTDHAFHGTLEPSYGINKYFEIGGYFLTAWVPGLPYEWAGAKLRAKVRIPCDDHWNFALNFEVSYSPPQFDTVWASEIRPIIEYRNGHFHADLNPNLDFDWLGKYTGVPQLEPCVSFNYEVAAIVSIGIEYYVVLGPVTAIAPIESEYHAVFLVSDIAIGHLPGTPGFTWHVGVGHGFTPVSSPLEVTSILGMDF